MQSIVLSALLCLDLTNPYNHPMRQILSSSSPLFLRKWRHKRLKVTRTYKQLFAQGHKVLHAIRHSELICWFGGLGKELFSGFGEE